ncbi:nucleoside triphosphatase YtkD [Priestia aryabhattai]|uniref:RNA deprotection pyrophosphohydrolase n=1 Tax=Bacillaceae TaxID=186817 RepID=UPI000BA0CB39|nr:MULTISPECIES: nucleoside triphosphatase YtkD [Bacillaceae]MDT2045121.1 nucleoside triphosphatase YtkD [Priestia flexa]OZT12299.1 nucleoside triphosphatase YtkD [Priestia aryabhattai]TDB51120.1 nucleoside triphosphatase YtkD [Bacillus sp. CBEL-1]USY54796.1 nucleoside triphosphatase YtkD [Bacillus sp. 1780r2a1]
MYTFKDAYHNQVFLSFERSPFSKTPRHVWVVCRYKGQWLLTNHSKRGLEFPGGKLELEETPEEAAVREVFEETGGEVENLSYIGQYKVVSKGKTIIKNIYFANVSNLVPKDDYMETKGPVIIQEIPEQGIQKNTKYSFIMKDNVLQYVMKHVKRTFL